jgi:histidine triad (HIT) family protein
VSARSSHDGACVFCAIIAREDSHPGVVLRDELCIAFLDHKPVFEGHCLLVPRVHVETLVDLPDALVEPVFKNAKLLARSVVAALGAHGSFVAMNNVVSQSVPHLHVHVVPRRRKDGLRGFFWPRTAYASDEDYAETARRLRVWVEDARRSP